MKINFLNNIIMFMLVSSTGGLLFVYNRNQAFLVLFLIIVFALIYIGKKIKKTAYYSSLLALCVILLLFLINFIFAINPQSITKYTFFGISIFTTVLTLFYYSNQDNKLVFLNSLYNVLKLILFHSLLSFIAYYFVKNNLVLITSEYHDSLTFNYLFYYSPKIGNTINLFGFDIHRNAGMFWEPGILQAYLNILFFLEVSFFNKNRVLLFFIIIAIISTYSTTGLFLLIIQVIYFTQKNYKKTLAPVLFAILVVPLYFLFNLNMSDKIGGESDGSFQKRLIDLTQPFFIALEHPLTGVGLDLDRFQEVREEFYINTNINKILGVVGIQQNVETTSKGSTNSVMYLLAGMGFPTAILFIYMLIKQQVINRDRLIWFIIIFVSVMSEPLLLRPFFFLFIVAGFVSFFNKIIGHKKQLG